ncbi:DUF4838 domain-containing protein [bacterium]|nr:DUF4838 domain-containing protein [bacterium]
MHIQILIAALAIAPLAVTANAITLSEHGKTLYHIVVSDDATQQELTAAYQLHDYLKQVTGADFPVRSDSLIGPDEPQILVGQSKRVSKLASDVDWSALASDGIVIRTDGDKLILAGGRPRGSLYAVYSFLEDTVGCHWWTGTESYIPTKNKLDIPKLDIKYTPKLRYRETFYRDVNENPLFAVKLKLNGHFNNIPDEYGGHYNIIGWCHTFFQFLPPDKYFAAHPDWYSLIDGKRVDNKQLCLTNDEMRAEMTRVVLDLIKQNPTSGIISISQNDVDGGNCQCEKCKAIETEEESPSGPLIRFVNLIAADIEKQYPDMLVETLAYQYTLKPPAYIKPRENVVIRLCSIGCDFAKPADSDTNREFRDSMHTWSAIAPHLYVWDYVTDFARYIQPHPNMHVLGPNIKFFVGNKTMGLFEQGDAGCSIGEFVRLRAWVIAHLEWNPSSDQKQLTSEFLKGYYGSAAPFLQSYLELVHDSIGKNGQRLGCYNTDLSFLTLDVMSEATRLFDEAEKSVADDPVIFQRVRRERMTLDYAWLLRYNDLKKEAAAENVPFAPPFDPAVECDKFIERARQWNVGESRESRSFESYVPELKAMFAK